MAGAGLRNQRDRDTPAKIGSWHVTSKGASIGVACRLAIEVHLAVNFKQHKNETPTLIGEPLRVSRDRPLRHKTGRSWERLELE